MDGRDCSTAGMRFGWGGLASSPVTYAYSLRCTHSDVMATTTTTVRPLDEGLERERERFVRGKTHSHQQLQKRKRRRAGNVGLSVPAARLNRELWVERKLFMDRLQRERIARNEVEQTAATLIQAVSRGAACRGDRGSRPGAADPKSWGQAAARPRPKPRRPLTLAALRKQLLHLQKATERVLPPHANLNPRQSGNQAGSSGPGSDHGARRPGRRSGGGGGGGRAALPPKRLHPFAVQIQCLARKKAARRATAVARLYRAEEAERAACTVIQARFRAHHDRQRAAKQELAQSSSAATRIQAHVRRRRDAQFARVLRQHLDEACQEQSAALGLQRLLRGRIAKQKALGRRMEKASRVVQTAYRGHSCLHTYEQQKKERLASAIAVQKTYRGSQGRRRSADVRAESAQRKRAAAVKVQALCRGHGARQLRARRHEGRAARAIQTRTRQHAAKKRVAERRLDREQDSAAVRIQTTVRRKAAHRRASAQRRARREASAATAIQGVHRARQAKRERERRDAARKGSAATLVQSAHRASAARKSVHKVRRGRAATRIQSGFRKKTATSDLQHRRTQIRAELMAEAEAQMEELLRHKTVKVNRYKYGDPDAKPKSN